jgi:hypothetical protein
LLALQPSEQRREEDLERNHGLSLRQCFRPSFRTLRDQFESYRHLGEDIAREVFAEGSFTSCLRKPAPSVV